MNIADIGDRVEFANAIHKDRALSKLIQRSLEGRRASNIAKYLLENKQRFFNSLVLATYGGEPEWLEIGSVTASNKTLLDELSDEARDALGFLRLSGGEKMFALDGQHRLAGIKKALETASDIGEEQLSVIFVAHRNTKVGMERTRRLFTTLNKTAKPVQKRDIIALDEDDSMAIIARRLVETNDHFKDPRIAVISTANIPVRNQTCLATISGLYDILQLLFSHLRGKKSDIRLRFERPSDQTLEQYYIFAESYFQSLGRAFPPVQEFFAAEQPMSVTEEQRGNFGGHLLFRPIGLDGFTRTAIAYCEQHKIELSAAVERLSVLPTDIAAPPFKNVIWDPISKRILISGKKLSRDILFFLSGLEVDVESLVSNYAKATGQNEAAAKRKLQALRIA